MYRMVSHWKDVYKRQVYNILGMEKRHIARVLGLETVFVAMLVIVGGILSGIIFSKLILMLLYRMLGFQESVSFYIAKAGIAWAVIVFGVLYMLTLLYNLLQIRLANPIEMCIRDRHNTGCNFTELLVKYRLELACRLLRESRLKVGEICEIIGYRNLEHFNRQFRKEFDRTPTQYRREHRGNVKKDQI